MTLRRKLPLAACAASLVVAALWRPVRAVGRVLRIGTADYAQTLCSDVFVSGLDPGRVAAEELDPQSGLGRLKKRLHIEVDRTRRRVAVTWAGRFESTATFRDGLGCSLHDPPPGPTPVTSIAPSEGPAVAAPTEGLRRALDHAFAEPNPRRPRHVRAVVIWHDGRVVAERYASGVGPDTPLIAYSMSKSIVSALIGILVREGRLDLKAPAPVVAWSSPADPRHAITIEELLRMTSGLDLDEDDSGFDPVSRMFFLEPDMAAFAAAAPLAAAPGTRWRYTSGNTLILCAILRDAVGGRAADVRAFAEHELFEPLGMRNVTMEFDAAGSPIGASRIFASARDWARFGQLYLDDGRVGGRRLLPEGWVRFSTTPTLDSDYGAGFWLDRGHAADARYRVEAGMPEEAFYGSGAFGQRLVILPSQRLVIVRLGPTIDPPNFDMRGLETLVSEVVAERSWTTR